jgi:uncharacterized membrane protein YqgA involved in biofilm formation
LSQGVIGTIVNAACIVLGGVAGLAKKTPFSAANQNLFKVALGVFTVFYGLRLTWLSLNGPSLQIVKQLVIVVVALALGKVAGRLLHLQKASNGLGQFARRTINAAKPDDPARFTHGFLTCSALFCAAPLGVLGAVCGGLPVHGEPGEFLYPLVVKAVMDGLAAMGFASVFGCGVMLSAVPVLVFQGTMTLLCARFLQPVLGVAAMGSINATAGLLIFCVALIIFEIRRIEVTEYLPSLVFAPLLTWCFR